MAENVYKKLNKIQVELKAPKNQYNSFGKYHYRSLEDIHEGLKPLLKKYGAVVLLEDELVTIGDRYYVQAIATFIDIDNGEKISVKAYAREDEQKRGMDVSQLTGSTSSYARKYALNGLFAIDDTKDADVINDHERNIQNNNVRVNKKSMQKSNSSSPLIDKQKQLVELAKMKNKTNEMPKMIGEMFGKTHSNQLRIEEIDKLIAKLKSL